MKYVCLMTENIKNGEMKFVVVTGGARRIGLAMATRCLRMNFGVIIPHRNNLREIESAIEVGHIDKTKIIFVECDLLKNVSPLLSIIETYPVEGLINSAAIFEEGFADDSINLARQTGLNAFVPIELISALSENPSAKWAVNISDALIDNTSARFANYRLSKRLIEDVTISLAALYKGELRINCIAPGPVIPSSSDMDFFDRMRNLCPDKKLPTTDDVCYTLENLIRDQDITGEVVTVDCGISATLRH